MNTMDDATQEEQKDKARKLVENIPLPPEVAAIDVFLAADSTGEPALLLQLKVRKDIEANIFILSLLMWKNWEKERT